MGILIVLVIMVCILTMVFDCDFWGSLLISVIALILIAILSSAADFEPEKGDGDTTKEIKEKLLKAKTELDVLMAELKEAQYKENTVKDAEEILTEMKKEESMKPKETEIKLKTGKIDFVQHLNNRTFACLPGDNEKCYQVKLNTHRFKYDIPKYHISTRKRVNSKYFEIKESNSGLLGCVADLNLCYKVDRYVR